jgi:hypothetical protein
LVHNYQHSLIIDVVSSLSSEACASCKASELAWRAPKAAIASNFCSAPVYDYHE